MAEEITTNREVPAAGEPVHLPGPSYLPVVTAFGITLALVGVVLNVILLVIGIAITLGACARWIGETRGEISELPLEH